MELQRLFWLRVDGSRGLKQPIWKLTLWRRMAHVLLFVFCLFSVGFFGDRTYTRPGGLAVGFYGDRTYTRPGGRTGAGESLAPRLLATRYYRYYLYRTRSGDAPEKTASGNCGRVVVTA